MPTYEYACRKCGEHLEAVQAFTDDPLTICPNCKGELRKVFGAVGIVFKGSGFYKTDNRSNGSRSTVPTADTAATGTSSSGSEGSSSTTTSTESGASKEPAKEAAKSTPAAPAKGSASSSPTPASSTS